MFCVLGAHEQETLARISCLARAMQPCSRPKNSDTQNLLCWSFFSVFFFFFSSFSPHFSFSSSSSSSSSFFFLLFLLSDSLCALLSLMGLSASAPETPGGGTEGYHVLKVGTGQQQAKERGEMRERKKEERTKERKKERKKERRKEITKNERKKKKRKKEKEDEEEGEGGGEEGTPPQLVFRSCLLARCRSYIRQP